MIAVKVRIEISNVCMLYTRKLCPVVKGLVQDDKGWWSSLVAIFVDLVHSAKENERRLAKAKGMVRARCEAILGPNAQFEGIQ